MSQVRKFTKIQAVAAVTLAVTLTGFLGGCSKMGAHNNNNMMGQSEVREQKTNPEALKVVDTIGQTSEAVYDDIRAEQWQQASEKLSYLKKADDELKSSQLSKGSDQYVSRLTNDLDKQIQEKKRVPAMESANQLTRAAMDLGEPVEATLPKELSLLNYYGRELEIGALGNDKNKMHSATNDIKNIWPKLKPKVEAQGQTEKEAQFDQLVKKLEKAKSKEEYQQFATQILEQVDQMGGKFSKGGQQSG